VLQAVYPQHAWEQEKFVKVPRNYWSSLANVKNFVLKVGSEFNVREPSDWLKVSVEEFIERGGGGLLSRYSSLKRVLATVYPDSQFAKRSKHQSYSIYSKHFSDNDSRCHARRKSGQTNHFN
jgi:hypothetical protein